MWKLTLSMPGYVTQINDIVVEDRGSISSRLNFVLARRPSPTPVSAGSGQSGGNDCEFLTSGKADIPFIRESPDLILGIVANSEGVTVGVMAMEFTSPNIIQIIVTRNGKPIAPIKGRLRESELTNRLGASRIVHNGELLYPRTAFAPGAKVTVTAVPQRGEKLTKTYNCMP